MSITRPRAQAFELPQLFLRIQHPSIDPAEITRVIGIQPEHATPAGTTVAESGVRRLYSETYWLAELPNWGEQIWGTSLLEQNRGQPMVGPSLTKDDLPFMQGAHALHHVCIVAWLRKLEPQREFFARINNTNGSVTLLLNRAQRQSAFVLPPVLARRLADTGVALEID